MAIEERGDMREAAPIGDTQNLIGFINEGNKRTLDAMRESEERLARKLENPSVKCEIQDPLLDVFRAQRAADAQIMDNQVFTFSHIVGRLDDIHSNNGTGGCSSPTEPEMNIGKGWFSSKGYRMQDLISLIVIAALVAVCLTREYINYLRFSEKISKPEQLMVNK